MADSSTGSDQSAVPSDSSIWLWLFRPLSIAITSIGIVMFVAGITSFYGVGNRNLILLTPVGGFILSCGLLLAVGVVCRIREQKKMVSKARRSGNDILDLTAEFATIGISVDTMNFVEVSAGQDERCNLQEPIPELPPSPPRYEDVVPASSIAAPALPAYATSVVDNDEVLIALEDPDQFECPPSYEQAISGDNDM